MNEKYLEEIRKKAQEMSKPAPQKSSNNLAKVFVGGAALATLSFGTLNAQNIKQDNPKLPTKETFSQKSQEVSYDYQSPFKVVQKALGGQMLQKNEKGDIRTGFNNRNEEISFSIVKTPINNAAKKSTNVAVIREGDTYYMSYVQMDSSGNKHLVDISYDKSTGKVGALLDHGTKDEKGNKFEGIKANKAMPQDANGNINHSRSTEMKFYHENGSEVLSITNWTNLIESAMELHNTQIKEAKENGSLKPIVRTSDDHAVSADKTIGFYQAQQMLAMQGHSK